MNELKTSMNISASALKTQGQRMRIIAENLANANSTGRTPGEDPYRRQTIFFRNVMDRELGVKTVRVDKIGRSDEAFPQRYDPAHPAADQNGYYRLPNINTLMEQQDMKEAQRSYEANLTVIEAAKAMAQRTLDVLR